MAKKKSKKKGKSQRRSLNPLREQLQVLVDQANQRANLLIENNLQSRALMEAQRTLMKKSSRRNDSELFRADLPRKVDINKEFARVHAFLNDYTSTMGGAYNFESDLASLEGAFGGRWKTETGENYDTSRIDKQTAEKTFDLYRRVIESAGGWERAVGLFQGKESLVGYGSENLITAIYDMVQNNVNDGDIMNLARDMVESGIQAYTDMAERQVKDYDYGIVFDDEEAQARRAFYTWRRQYNGRG